MIDFLSTVATVVIHTPTWVWPLYALLLFLGYQRTRDSVLPLWRMLILPAVVTVLAMISVVGAGTGGLPAVVLGLVVGSAIGWRLEPPAATRRLPDGRVWLRGEWVSLVQIVMVLVFRYAVNVAPVLDPALRSDATWHFGTLLVSTILSAVFLGRTATRLRVFAAGRKHATLGSVA